MNVAVIGASNKPERYSYKAVMLLKEKGHNVFPIHRRVKEIEGMSVYPSIGEISDAIDTITLYVNSEVSSEMQSEILSKKPRRIIFNPGAENETLESFAKEKGIEGLKACTLVLLTTNQF